MIALKRWGIPLFLFILALSVRVYHLDGYITVDEPRWLERSAKFTSGLLFSEYQCPPERDGRQFDATGLECTYQAGYPAVTTTWTAALGFLVHYALTGQSNETDLATYLANIKLRDLDPSLILPARMGGAIVNALFVPLFYLLVLRLFSWRLAFIAALLVALGPFYIALSRVLHHDALTTSFMVVSLLTMIGYWCRKWPLHWLIISGLMAGFGFLTKPVAWYLAPCAAMIGGLSLLYHWQSGNPPTWKAVWQVIKEGLLWGVIAGLTCFVFFPALWVIPLKTLSGIFTLTGEFTEEGHIKGQFFLGEVYNDPGLVFYPLGWLLKASPFEVIGLLLLPLASWFAFKAQKDRSLRTFIAQHPVELALLLFLATFFLFVNVSNKKFVRYFLPAFPILSIFASFGLMWLVKALGRLSHNHQWQRAMFPVLVGAILVIQGFFIIQNAPTYFTYYNPMFGNNAAAAQLMTTYGWGDQMAKVADYLNQKPQAESLRVVAWYNIAMQPFFAGKAHDFSSQPGNVMDSDYVVYHVNQLQRQLQDEAIWQYFRQHYTAEKRIAFNGLDYALIYQNPIARHVDWESNSLPDVATIFGYTLLPDGEATLYWQNLGIAAGYKPWLGLSPAGVGASPVWTACRLADGFDTEMEIAQPVLESVCPLADGQLAAGVYDLHVGLGDESPLTTLEFPAGQLAIALDSQGQFAAIERDTALKLIAQQALPPEATALNLLFGDIAGLVGYHQAQVQPGQPAVLSLYWQPTDKLDLAFADAFQLNLQLETPMEGSATMLATSPLIPPAAAIQSLTPGLIVAIEYPYTLPASMPAGEVTLNACLTVADNNQPVFGVAADGAVFQCLPIPIIIVSE